MIFGIFKNLREQAKNRRLNEIKRRANELYSISDYTDSQGIVHIGVFVGGSIAYYVGNEETLEEAITEVEALRKEFINKEMKDGIL